MTPSAQFNDSRKLDRSQLLAVIPFTSVKDPDYGAVGDGVTDDTAAIQAAIDATSASEGGTVYFPPGIYVCSLEITLPDGVTLLGAGKGQTVVTFDGASVGNFANQACILAEGAATSLGSLAADVDKYATSMTLSAPPSGVSDNDIVSLYDSTDSSFNGARPVYRAGEFLRVIGVSAATVTFASPTFDAYASGSNVTAYHITTVSVGVTNMTLRGIGTTASIAPIRVRYGRNCVFSDLSLSGTQWTHLVFDRCFDCDAARVDCYDNGANNGTNYGIGIFNSQRIRVRDCDMHVVRHCVAHGSVNDINSVPCRETLVSGCHFTARESSAIDAHGNTEHYKFVNCWLHGGATIGGDNSTVENCTFVSTTGFNSGKAVVFTELIGADHKLIGCTIIQGAPTAAAMSVLVDWNTNTAADDVRRAGGEFLFSACKWRCTDAERPLLLTNRSNVEDISARFEGCIVRRNIDVTINNAIFGVRGVDNLKSYWRSVVFDGCDGDGVSFFANNTGAETIAAINTAANNSGGYGIRLSDSGSGEVLSWGSRNATVEGRPTDGNYQLTFTGYGVGVPVTVTTTRTAGVPATNDNVATQLAADLTTAAEDALAGTVENISSSGNTVIFDISKGLPSGTVTASAPSPGTLTMSSDVLQSITAQNCHARGSLLNGVYIQGRSSNVSTGKINGCTLTRNGRFGSGDSSTRGDVFAAQFRMLDLSANTMGDDQTVPLAIRLFAVNQIGLFIEGDNVNIGTVTATNVMNVTQRISRVAENIAGSHGSAHYEGWGTAAPKTGTWNQGDIVLNRNAEVGLPQGWRCIAKGTPGKWEPMPDL